MGQMALEQQRGEAGPDGPVELYTPDYHLTPDNPVWAASHVHAVAGPWAMSMHAGVEVGLVLAGREEVEIGDTLIEGRPGDVWLCSVSELHRYRVVAPNTQNLVIVFLPSLLGEEMLGSLPWTALVAAPPADRPRSSEEMRLRLLQIGREMEAQLARRADGWQSILRLDLLRLLFYLSRRWHHDNLDAAAAMSSIDRIMPALQLVQQRLPGRVTRQEAAWACGLGPSRFTMLFGELMGVSFTTYRRRTRLVLAANLLVTTDLAVEQIAERAGFSDASHLHHSFVREHGCTPGQYRKQAQRPRVERPDGSARRGRGADISRREGPAAQ
jgi:AraC-like DNA-binding protein